MLPEINITHLNLDICQGNIYVGNVETIFFKDKGTENINKNKWRNNGKERCKKEQIPEQSGIEKFVNKLLQRLLL